MVLNVFKILLLSSVVALLFVQSSTSSPIQDDIIEISDEDNLKPSDNSFGQQVVKTDDIDVSSTYKRRSSTKTILSPPCCDELSASKDQISQLQVLVNNLMEERAENEARIEQLEELITQLRQQIEENSSISPESTSEIPLIGSENEFITATINALDGQEDLTLIRQILLLVGNQLDYMFSSSDGFTFFAPTNEAIGSKIMQDASLPFYENPEFAGHILLRHFALRNLPQEELFNLTMLEMADWTAANVTHSEEDSFINDAKIQGMIQLEPVELGTIYVIDQFFTTTEEIEAATMFDTKRKPNNQKSSIKDLDRPPIKYLN